MAMVTKGGRWIYRDADIHRCPKPNYEKDAKAGDRWQCNECSKVWVVTKVNHHYDPRPGESYSTLDWREEGDVRPTPGVTSWRDR